MRCRWPDRYLRYLDEQLLLIPKRQCCWQYWCETGDLWRDKTKGELYRLQSVKGVQLSHRVYWMR